MATEEEIKAAEEKTAADKAAEEAEAERVAALSDEDREAEKKAADSKLDYEAELKAERERGKQEGIAEAAFKFRKKKKDAESEDEDEDDEEELDKPLTARQLQEALAGERQATEKKLQSSLVLEKAAKLASSDQEKELIIEIHKNRTFPKGMSLDEQIEEAYAIANKKRFPALLAEAKRALISKDTASGGAVSTHREASASSEPKMSSADTTAIKKAGFVWDGGKRLWKKPLNGGKSFLYKDPKTLKVYKGS